MKSIILATAEVREILDKQRAVLRRVIKPQPNKSYQFRLGFLIGSRDRKTLGRFFFGNDEYGRRMQYAKSRYIEGDILYVRETWGNWAYDDLESSASYYQFRADYPDGAKTYEFDDAGACDKCFLPRWHPSVRMPKEAARTFLHVTDVRVERVQDMTLDDFLNEGITVRPEAFNDPENAYGQAKKQFETFWNSTIKKTDLSLYGWEANPWVWVYEFERCENPCST